MLLDIKTRITNSLKLLHVRRKNEKADDDRRNWNGKRLVGYPVPRRYSMTTTKFEHVRRFESKRFHMTQNRPVARFQIWAKHILGEKDFCFNYKFKPNFLGTTKFGEHKNMWEELRNCIQCPHPVTAGPYSESRSLWLDEHESITSLVIVFIDEHIFSYSRLWKTWFARKEMLLCPK